MCPLPPLLINLLLVVRKTPLITPPTPLLLILIINEHNPPRLLAQHTTLLLRPTQLPIRLNLDGIIAQPLVGLLSLPATSPRPLPGLLLHLLHTIVILKGGAVVAVHVPGPVTSLKVMRVHEPPSARL